MFIKTDTMLEFNSNIETVDMLDNGDSEVELSMFGVSGTGTIVITNTGGSSASEGGMGTGGGPEKGAGIAGAEGGDSEKGSKEEADETWDPLKPKEEKGKEKS